MKALVTERTKTRGGGVNALLRDDEPVHGWYRFVLSFPPHLVRQYAQAFGLGPKDLLLDPFCGTGTTLVEAKKNRIPSIGCDAHPFAALVSRVKTDWSLDVPALGKVNRRVLKKAEGTSAEHGLEAMSFEPSLWQEELGDEVSNLCLTEDEERLLPTGFLSARPLRRLLILRNEIERQAKGEPGAIRDFLFVALAHVIANGAGNFAFGPEIYRTKPKPDYDVLGHFARQVERMARELAAMQVLGLDQVQSSVLQVDARELGGISERISAVITSPPYPNEKDYTRTTRVESILLRLFTDKAGLREAKEALLRSNTRNIFVDDCDGAEVEGFESIRAICDAIESRRIELGKTSGFERLYHKVVAHYFGGMRRHLRALRAKLKPGARLAYVVGDQLSFLMVPVPTATLLGEVAESEGYRTIGCDLWRERVGTKVRNDVDGRRTVRVREEVLLLEKA